MQETPTVEQPTVRQDDLGLLRLSAIPMTLAASVLTATWGAYLFAIGMSNTLVLKARGRVVAYLQ